MAHGQGLTRRYARGTVRCIVTETVFESRSIRILSLGMLTWDSVEGMQTQYANHTVFESFPEVC
jgi:hypothetical protein